MQPLISIVIPTYNADKTIADSISSLLEQTYSNFEIIVIDDGSTDNTVNIIKTFTDKRIKLFKRRHLGPAAQRNYGIKKSKGEYIALFDSDDIAFYNRLEKQIAYMQSNSKIEILGSQAIFIDTNKMKTSIYDVPIDDLDYFFPVNCPIITSTILFRKRILSKVGLFDEKLEPATDYEWLVKANRMGICIKNTHHRLVKVRISSESFTRKKRKVLFKKMSFLTNIQMEELYQNKKKDYDYFFRKGLIFYYYGNCHNSIIFFLKAIITKPSKILINLRYILPSFLGNKLLSTMRTTKISLLLNRFIQNFGKNFSYIK